MFKRILISFLLVLMAKSAVVAGNSVLESGVWYKMSIALTGMYKLSYSDLASMGIDVANIDPRNIRIYHNGGGVLPKINKCYYPDDLYEIPIFVSGEDDGVFNQNDYILFYARGPVVWKYDIAREYYRHQKNPYTSYTYAFLTVGDSAGRRIQTEPSPDGDVTHVTDFLDYKVKDVDEVNINNMGCTWFFDRFDITLQRYKEPAHITALRKMDKFRSNKYWVPEKQKQFYSGVTDGQYNSAGSLSLPLNPSM